MEVLISAPACDQGTAHLAERIHRPLEKLSSALSNDYGGEMQHLWINLELVPLDADRREPLSFRYQKVVTPRPLVGVIPKKTYNNVGHYSVRPDHFALAEVPLENVTCYLMRLIYESTSVLEKNSKNLGGFNVKGFRTDFISAMKNLGCRE